MSYLIFSFVPSECSPLCVILLSWISKVSYKEFRALVLHPNPGVVDLLKEVHKANENDVLKEKQALAGKKQGVDHNAFHRQKEMTQVAAGST